MWAALSGRYGRSDAARQMVDVLMLCRELGPSAVELAVRGALTAGAIDGRAVAVLARRAQTGPARTLVLLGATGAPERASHGDRVPSCNRDLHAVGGRGGWLCADV